MEGFEDIKGFENRYMINRAGEVFSYSSNKKMKKLITEDGYVYFRLVCFEKDLENNTITKKDKKKTLHRLLALQFIPNPDNLPEVDHIDRDKLNNSLNNLRWVTRHINARNKEKCIDNLTPEEIDKRTKVRLEYQRIWAENKRRDSDIEPRVFLTNLTEEEKKERNKQKQKEWHQKNRKITIIEPKVILTPEERVIKNREYKKEWARQKRSKLKNNTP